MVTTRWRSWPGSRNATPTARASRRSRRRRWRCWRWWPARTSSPPRAPTAPTGGGASPASLGPVVDPAAARARPRRPRRRGGRDLDRRPGPALALPSTDSARAAAALYRWLAFCADSECPNCTGWPAPGLLARRAARPGSPSPACPTDRAKQSTCSDEAVDDRGVGALHNDEHAQAGLATLAEQAGDEGADLLAELLVRKAGDPQKPAYSKITRRNGKSGPVWTASRSRE
jgi:hypothetical protein